MPNNSALNISRSELDSLIENLSVNIVQLAECLVSPGWKLILQGPISPGIHYNLSGSGQLITKDQRRIQLQPHTLVVLPAGHALHLEVPGEIGFDHEIGSENRTKEDQLHSFSPTELRRYVAGDAEPRLMLICGYFRATYGVTIDPFASLSSPIVEQFDSTAQLDRQLRSALDELIAQEVGAGAMTTALMKQVLVAVIRRSLRSRDVWAERFCLLSDPHVARAFAEMVARPGGGHSVTNLAHLAGLSRSAFMARFKLLFGMPPMTALRDLRMRHAAMLLAGNKISVDQAAHEVGYTSRSSFLRAFRKVIGYDPSKHGIVDPPDGDDPLSGC
ncbi:helix-turn-helix transcriptional regulator [Methylobacterium sp. 391_Methyba4]|uniref:helix-turn-helix transcriptional regulator n=1 Tax=Methylobacterium sp. 391_Methyba4 TaxID=3038924 RepID=UPI00241D4D4C|nr:AraC family transcriptional regulator [Methylobacterium sp. 391_Methyba4]WFS09672.1 AraC family transcriptional regulator [Methylobacterium sp. 391_Methyba4]